MHVIILDFWTRAPGITLLGGSNMQLFLKRLVGRANSYHTVQLFVYLQVSIFNNACVRMDITCWRMQSTCLSPPFPCPGSDPVLCNYAYFTLCETDSWVWGWLVQRSLFQKMYSPSHWFIQLQCGSFCKRLIVNSSSSCGAQLTKTLKHVDTQRLNGSKAVTPADTCIYTFSHSASDQDQN